MYLTPRGTIVKDYNIAEREYSINLSTIEPDFYEFVTVSSFKNDFPDIKSYVDYLIEKSGLSLSNYRYEVYVNSNGENRIRVIVSAVIVLDVSLDNINIQSLL
ncbi:MAG: hypothetical protein QXF12_00175 [Candidatus Aenigmatarchaeota archaeon]